MALIFAEQLDTYALRLILTTGSPRMSLWPGWAPSYLTGLEGLPVWDDPVLGDIKWEKRGLKRDWYTYKVEAQNTGYQDDGLGLELAGEGNIKLPCVCEISRNERAQSLNGLQDAITEGSVYLLSQTILSIPSKDGLGYRVLLIERDDKVSDANEAWVYLTATVILLQETIPAKPAPWLILHENPIAPTEFLPRGGNQSGKDLSSYKRNTSDEAQFHRELNSFHLAAKEDDESTLQQLLATNKNQLEARDEKGWAPLHTAAFNGHVSSVKLLLDHGASVDHGDYYGRSPLMLAADEGHIDVVKELLQYSASVNLSGANAECSLNLAIRGGHYDTVRVLLAAGASPTDRDQYRFTPFAVASLKDVQFADLLISAGLDLYARDVGCTILNFAARAGNVPLIKRLLELGMPVDVAETVDEKTPLWRAIEIGEETAVSLLLDHGANPSHTINTTWTCFLYAVEVGNYHIVKALLQYGADAITICQPEGWTALHIACHKGHRLIVKLLLMEGCKVDIKDSNGATPLQLAELAGHTAIVNILQNSDDPPRLFKQNKHITAAAEPELRAFMQNSPGSCYASGNVHWTVTRSVNKSFTGREDILIRIQGEIRRSLRDSIPLSPKTFVITGMGGGRGKSEICLRVAYSLRQMFWGVFWVDVADPTWAERMLIDIGNEIQPPTTTFHEAKQVLAGIENPWLLILDNADDPDFDYETYFPPGNSGVLLLTSRNTRCSQYANIGSEEVLGLEKRDAVRLLLRTAEIPPKQWHVLEEVAGRVADVLDAHPLALIQAGSYISQGHCTLQEYEKVYRANYGQILKSLPETAQSRYAPVYATFEASAQALGHSSDPIAQEALRLLCILSVLAPCELPVRIFQAAWSGCKAVLAEPGEAHDKDELTASHVSQLAPLIQADIDEWDSVCVVHSIQLLKALHLIVENTQHGSATISMSRLMHCWAWDRQAPEDRVQAWMSAGIILGLSHSDTELWQIHEPQLRSHLHFYLDERREEIRSREVAAPILVWCGWLLDMIQDLARLESLVELLLSQLSLNPLKPSQNWMGLYHLMARISLRKGKGTEAVSLLEQIVQIREQTRAGDSPGRLASQHELARAYHANGQVIEAVKLLDCVVKVREQSLPKDHPHLQMARDELKRWHQNSRERQKELLKRLEDIVKSQEQRLPEDHPDRLRGQCQLAKAYVLTGQRSQAIALIEHVIKIRKQKLAIDDPQQLELQNMWSQMTRLQSRSGSGNPE